LPNISDINGVAIASLGDFNGVAKASITDINGVTVVVSGTNLLLDTYTGAAAAYSVRKLDKDYTGNCMRIRRDSDDSETDIGFDGSGDLDTSAIATHCGSANGYVVTWYDQANVGGTAVNATQSTGGSAVNTVNGKPVVKSAAGAFMSTTVDASLKIFTVASLHRTAGVMLHWIDPGLAGGWVLAAQSGSTAAPPYDGFGVSPSIKLEGLTVSKNGASYSITSKNRGDIYTDFNSQHLGFFDATIPGRNNVGFGYEANSTSFPMWDMQEVILYPSTSSHSQSGIEGNINAHFQIGNFGTPTSGLLSTYTGAAAAYSVRQLANTAALSMRVRRDNDDAEQDFGFDANGDLDTAAIATFVGSGNNGYVSKWYDQSGNGNDAEQSTNGSQPQIYNGSAVITENGKPALDFDGSDDFFNYTTTSTLEDVFVVQTTSDTAAVLFSSSTTGSRWHWIAQDGNSGADTSDWRQAVGDYGYKNGSLVATQGTTTRDQLHAALADGNQNLTSWEECTFATADSYYLGKYYSAGFEYDGQLQEVILYSTDQSSNRSGIEGNINAHFQIGNFSNPTSGLLSTYTGAAVAYSVRQLANTAIKCLRVRRDNDDAEQDFGFDANGDLDTAAIATFVGSGNNGYVSKWYDQSGNGNDAEQSTNGNQPQIYDGSAVITRSSKVSIYFPTSGVLQCTTGSMTQPNTTFTCADFISGKVIDASSGRRNFEVKAGGNIALWSGSSPFTTTTGGGFAGTGDLQLISTILDGSSTTHKLNNATPQTCAAGTGGSTGFYFGGQVGQFNGHLYISEFIAYESDESTDQSDIVTNQNNYFSIY